MNGLKPCPYCHEDVPAMAQVCPFCGDPTRNPPSRRWIQFVAAGLLAFLVIGVLLGTF